MNICSDVVLMNFARVLRVPQRNTVVSSKLSGAPREASDLTAWLPDRAALHVRWLLLHRGADVVVACVDAD